MQLQRREIVGASVGPHLLITGGVHGDEFEPMAAIRRLMTEIDPKNLRGRVTLVPVVNEPAFLRGHRTAEDGRDLARTCPGRVDGSITEQIAAALSELIRSANYYIDLHTGGTGLVVTPLAGYGLHRNREVLDGSRRMARAFNLPVIWGTNPDLDGRSLSVARDANVPAIYAEYLGGAQCDPAGIEAYVDGCLNVMGELGMIDRVQPASRVEYLVEDDRPSSGHMQICHPAPMTGFFDISVKLLDRVQKGDLLGTICDPLGERVEPLYAEHGGLVIVLHTFRRVIEGTGLVVVMET